MRLFCEVRNERPISFETHPRSGNQRATGIDSGRYPVEAREDALTGCGRRWRILVD